MFGVNKPIFKLDEFRKLEHERDLKKAQGFVDSEVLRLSKGFIPRRSGKLIESGGLNTKLGSGIVIYRKPYARYMYYGKVMVDPMTGKACYYNSKIGYWSRPHVKKVVSSRDIKYQGAPKRGAFWFERMKEKYTESILKGAAAYAHARNVPRYKFHVKKQK